MTNFVKGVVKVGISTGIECCITPCIFTKQEFNFLSRFVGNFRFKCEPILDVFPDLSVHYCMGMPIVSQIAKNNTLTQIFLEQVIISEHFRRRPRAKACLICKWWKSKMCQGYCLQYKYDKDNPDDRELLTRFKWLEQRNNENKIPLN